MIVVALLAVLVLLASSHLYLWRRLVRDVTGSRRLRRAGVVAAVAGPVLMALAMVAQRLGGAWDVLAWPGFVWLALWFYLVLALGVLELPRWWLRRRRPAPPAPLDPGPEVTRRLLISRGVAVTAGVTALGTVGHGMRQALGPPRLDRQQIVLPTLDRSLDGTRLVVVSDIHLGPLAGRAHVQRVVHAINDLNADVVAIVGDLVDGTVAARGPAAEPLAGIRARRGTWFVTGNHEYFSGAEPWLDRLADLGVHTLRNERREIVLGRGAFDLAGVNDPSGAAHGDPPDHAAALADRDRTRPVVLMAHQPVLAHEAARYGVDLQVSGHTHGGQMVPFNLAVGLQQPVTSGWGEVDGVPVYVTNGAGFWGPPVRVGAPPQVTLIQLRSP